MEVTEALRQALSGTIPSSGEVLADLPAALYDLHLPGFRPLPAEGEGMLCYIDGGSAELLSAPHVSVQLLRRCCLRYRFGKEIVREEQRREEHYLVVRASRQGALRYEAELLGKGSFTFNPEDSAFLVQGRRPEPGAVAGAVRRIYELELAAEMSHAGTMVLDGTLEARYPGERELLDRCGPLLAVAKRCSLLTQEGEDLLRAVSRCAPQGTWSALLAEGRTDAHRARVHAVKLHPRSRHVFRVESSGPALGLLARHSRDAAFPGYPYGLIAVDRLARISNEERQFHRSLLSSRLGSLWQELDTNAHGILDSMEY